MEYAAYMDAEPADANEAHELADWLFGRQQFPKLDGVDTEVLGAEVISNYSNAWASWHHPIHRTRFLTNNNTRSRRNFRNDTSMSIP